MEYNTRYKIESTTGTSIEELTRVLADLETGFCADQDCKWYYHEKDVVAAMVITGAIQVTLHGVGEENGDVWDKIFMKGGQKVQIRVYRYTLVRPDDPTSAHTLNYK